MGINCWNCKELNASTSTSCGHCRNHDGTETPLLIGRYEVLGYLGGGAFGRVYKCHDPRLDRIVAIKVLRGGSSEELDKEIRNAAKLDSINIVRIYDAPIDKPYFVMEFVEGRSIADLIRESIGKVQANFDSLFIQICEGLRVAHEAKIIHRDIKAENIMVTGDYRVKIADFGLAKRFTLSSPAKSMVGTAHYAAPEIWNREEYDERVDIFSFGVLCYYIWTGQFPFNGPSDFALGVAICNGTYLPPEQINDKIPDVVRDLIKQMLAPRDSRASSVETLKNILAARKELFPKKSHRLLEDFQREVDSVYGFKNQSRPPLVLLNHFSTNIAGVVGGILPGAADYNEQRTKFYLVKSFAWLCAVVSRINSRIEELIWLKFPDRCVYCDKQECACPATRENSEADINRALLEKTRSRKLEYEKKSFEFYRKMFSRIYGKRNDNSGKQHVFLRLFLEINEATDALMKINSIKQFDNMDILHLELADVIAWYFALLNQVGPSIDLEKEFFAMFEGHCYRCGYPACRCADVTEELINWRNVR